MSETTENTENHPEYVFCEFCQKEVPEGEAWMHDFEWYCEKCFKRLVAKQF